MAVVDNYVRAHCYFMPDPTRIEEARKDRMAWKIVARLIQQTAVQE